MTCHPLAEFATPETVELWTDEWKVRRERILWVTVAHVQQKAGVFKNVPDIHAKLAAYDKVIKDVRLWSIRDIEMRTHHDVKARLEEFNNLASACYGEQIELMHWGMTSADSVDNLSIIQMQEGMRWLATIAEDIDPYISRPLQAAAFELPFRGFKGPVGTQQDMLDLLGSPEAVDKLETEVANRLGFYKVMTSVGQVYPRSLDTQVGAALMSAVIDLDKNQPWAVIANGYFRMITDYSGDQWNEGDVSTSVVRRVALPGIFLAADAAIRGVTP